MIVSCYLGNMFINFSKKLYFTKFRIKKLKIIKHGMRNQTKIRILNYKKKFGKKAYYKKNWVRINFGNIVSVLLLEYFDL